MKYDNYGRAYTTEAELCDLLYKNPELDLGLFLVDGVPGGAYYNKSVHEFHLQNEMPVLQGYTEMNCTVEEFDQFNQQHWYMPSEYSEMDIAKWLLDQCKNDVELQRVGKELLLYQERNLFNLLQYLKYLVDTMRANNIVWGVGRGSSVASYVLYLIGVHKINSIYYDLDPEEFLK